MSATGLIPTDQDTPSIAVPKAHLDAFDRLMARGGVDAVVQRRAADDEAAAKRGRTK
jgi:hypothetical protein